LFEHDHVVLFCQIRDWDEIHAVHQSEISCEIEDTLTEMKRQLMHWKTPTSLRIKKSRMSWLQVKAMVIVFFIRGVITIELVSEGQAVNLKYYLEDLSKFRE
jgi:hypothetical protein